jgi:hypothetical protein
MSRTTFGVPMSPAETSPQAASLAAAPSLAAQIATFLALALTGAFGYVLPATGYFTAVPGDIGDARFNSVILEHFYLWLCGKQPSLWSPDFFYPFPGALAFSDNLLGSAPVYAFFRLMGLSRELAFDAWFALGNALNFGAAYIVGRRQGLPIAASSVGAFVFAFALPALIQEGHAQLTWRFAIPFAFLALVEIFEQRRIFPIWRLCLWVTVQFYCSIYLGVFLVELLVAMFAGFMLIGQPGDLKAIWSSLGSETPRRKGLIDGAAVLSVAAVGWLLAQYALMNHQYHFARPMWEIMSMLPRPRSYFMADRHPLLSWMTSWITDFPYRGEHQLFVGAGALVLAAIGVLSSHRFPQHRLLIGLSRGGLIFLFVATLSVLGVSAYRAIAWLPGLNSIRAVTRIILVMLMPLSMLAAIGAVRLLSRCRRPEASLATLAVLVALLSVEVLTYPPKTASIAVWGQRISDVRARLPADLPADAILFVRTGSTDVFQSIVTELDGMILGQDLGRPTLNGYSGNFPPGFVWSHACTSPQQRLASYPEFARVPVSEIDRLAARVVMVDAEKCQSAGQSGSGRKD